MSSKETRKILEEINKKTEKGLKLKELREKSEMLASQFQHNSFNAEIQKYNADLLKIYPEAKQLQLIDTSKLLAEIEKVKTQTSTDMDDLRKKIVAQKQELIKQGIKEDVNTLLQASENLQRQITNVQKDLLNYEQDLKVVRALHTERGKILTSIESSTEKVKQAITDAYVAFKSSRDGSSKEEIDLFEKIMQGVGIEGKVQFDTKVFNNEVLDSYFDNRKVPNETELKKIISGQNVDGSPKDITFDALSKWVQSDLSSQGYFSKGGLNGITEFIFTQWPKFLRVRAIAKLNEKPTDLLSIGQRGTLLLKVYLATASAKQVFVIDQPEDNLDNSFIMNELVPLIRKAKKSRQIIISTHNANLVVNTDAEQIIVARLDQEDEYLSGSLENPEIIENVCEILEGGEVAFKKREQKYHIQA